MIVDFVDVFLHFARQRWSDFPAAGFAFLMRSISVELRFKIDKHRATRSEFFVGDGLLKFCVTFVHFGVECSGVELFARHSEFVNERKIKTAEAFDSSVTSGFSERRGAATGHDYCGGTEGNVSRNKPQTHTAVP
jgi:hypothetical protein